MPSVILIDSPIVDCFTSSICLSLSLSLCVCVYVCVWYASLFTPSRLPLSPYLRPSLSPCCSSGSDCRQPAPLVSCVCCVLCAGALPACTCREGGREGGREGRAGKLCCPYCASLLILLRLLHLRVLCSALSPLVSAHRTATESVNSICVCQSVVSAGGWIFIAHPSGLHGGRGYGHSLSVCLSGIP